MIHSPRGAEASLTSDAMLLMTLLSALIRALPFILPRWQLACIGWILYVFAVFLADDGTKYV
jgi:hypothetical protein